MAAAAIAQSDPACGPLQQQLRAALDDAARADAPLMVVADRAMHRLVAEARAAAASRATILIGGPTGAGKDMLARTIHSASSRALGPFIAVNCAALPEAMLESLLFGHERGAFTGALTAAPGLIRAAERGTLFLDEVGELPLAMQAKLLRALQDHEVLPLGATRPVPVDIRVVAATNRDLAQDVASGRFREDLLWRLSVFPLTLPALAERPGDIIPLVAALLLRHARAESRAVPLPSESALEALLAHPWPGNVRELDNQLQRAAILCGEGPLQAPHLRLSPACIAPPLHAAPALNRELRTREADVIRAALNDTAGRRQAAAARLGISERTLRYKLAALAGRPRTMPSFAGAAA